MAENDQQGRRPDDITSTAADLKDKATEQFKKVSDQVGALASSTAEQAREAAERVEEVAGNMKGAVEKSLTQQPMATLAVAAVLGFVLGALWKS